MSLLREQPLGENNNSDSSEEWVDPQESGVVTNLQPLVSLLFELNLLSPQGQEKNTKVLAPDNPLENDGDESILDETNSPTLDDINLQNGLWEEKEKEPFPDTPSPSGDLSSSPTPPENQPEVDEAVVTLFGPLFGNSSSTNRSENQNLSSQEESLTVTSSVPSMGEVFEKKSERVTNDPSDSITIIPPSRLTVIPEDSSSPSGDIVHKKTETLAEFKANSITVTPSSSPLSLVPEETAHQELVRDIKEDDDPFLKLQDILMGSELSQVQQVNEIIERKLGSLEQQLYDPEKLIQLLLPHFTNLLSLKIVEAREEVAHAIAPIIDEALQKRSEDDKSSVILALAPLIPDAISTQIRNNPQEVAKAIGPEVAAAIQEQIKLDREAIADALGPEMGRAIKAQIEVERDAMVDALYPVIGNTISKYMAEAIRSINEKVERAFSLEGVHRKIRAKMQGVSEAELIFKDSIPFRVQAIFLIQKSSGLIISEIQKEGEHLEAEMIAGMLTAIRSFVQDCIVPPGELSELNQIEYGDSQIMLEVAGYCYLAVIVKGQHSQYFVTELRNILAEIIVRHGRAIEGFEGDQSTIPERVITLLNRLMNLPQETEKKQEKFPLALLAMILAGLGFILIPWTINLFRQSGHQEILAEVSQALNRTPDLSVYQLQSTLEGDQIKLTGRLPNKRLRQKAETVVKIIFPHRQIDNQITVIDVPPDPVIVEAEVKRITQVLNRHEGISIKSEYHHRQVNIKGTVMQMSDGNKITKAFQQIPGVQSVISTIKLNPLKITSRIYFEQNSVKLDEAYAGTINDVKAFLQQYPRKHLKIIGYSDRLGRPAKNQTLALQRAQAVQESLISQGVNPQRLEIVGSNIPPPDVDLAQPLILSRCVVFEPFNP